MEAYTFWPENMGEFRTVIQDIANHLEPGDFATSWSWMMPMGGPNENSLTLLGFWERPSSLRQPLECFGRYCATNSVLMNKLVN